MSVGHRAQHSAAEFQPSDDSPSGVLGDQKSYAKLTDRILCQYMQFILLMLEQSYAKLTNRIERKYEPKPFV
jgi:hypothetical protein